MITIVLFIVIILLLVTDLVATYQLLKERVDTETKEIAYLKSQLGSERRLQQLWRDRCNDAWHKGYIAEPPLRPDDEVVDGVITMKNVRFVEPVVDIDKVQELIEKQIPDEEPKEENSGEVPIDICDSEAKAVSMIS